MSNAILSAIVKRWLSKIKIAADAKEEQFGKAAREAMRFYAEPHDWYFDESAREVGGLSDSAIANGFKPTVNLVSNMVQVFLPVLYHKNPIRIASPRRCNLDPKLLQIMGAPPEMFAQDDARRQSVSVLLEHYLNYTPNELDLKCESRRALTEALVKGMGLLWTELVVTNGIHVAGSRYESIDNLLLDPDADVSRECKYAVRKRTRPKYEVEEEYGLPRGTLKGTARSTADMAELAIDEDYREESKQANTADLITYYEIYSRMGLGAKLSPQVMLDSFDEQLRDMLDQFGDNVFLAIAPGIDYPLNLPESVLQKEYTSAIEEVTQRIAWPIPLHDDDTNPWPFAAIWFHDVPGRLWPQSHVTPALAFQKAIDWIFRYLMGRVQICSRTFMVTPKELSKTIKEQLLSGSDLCLLEIEAIHAGTLEQICKFLQMPNVTGDIWQVLAAVQHEFEKATGMTELMHGMSSRQMRSAQEANVIQGNLSIRPDDMAGKVEDWMSLAARNEAIVARSMLGESDIAPAFGESYDPQGNMAAFGAYPQIGPYTQLWMALVHQPNIRKAASEYECRIESGTVRKPNLDKMRSDVDESAQVVFPPLLQVYMQTGDPTQANAWLSMYARSRGLPPDTFALADMREQLAMQQQQPMLAQQPPPDMGVAA